MSFLLPDTDFRIEALPNPEHEHRGMGVHMAPSAVRVTHKPSGLTEFCDETRSQLRNYAIARERLELTLLEALTAPGDPP